MTADPLRAAEAALSRAQHDAAHALALMRQETPPTRAAAALLEGAINALRDAHGSIGDLYAQSNQPHQ